MFEGFANVWTPAITAKELGKRPVQVRIGGESLVLFRDGKGGLGALLDRCPHRGVALSGGTIDADGCITCPFHGWSFQKDGACANIPLNDLSADKRARNGATPIPAREIGGLIWVYTGPDPAGSEPELPPALVEPGWFVGFNQQIWKTHWTRAMENMLDTAHLPFVHGRSFAKEIRNKLRPGSRLEVRVEPAPFGSRIFSKWDWEPEIIEILKWRRPNAMELHILDEQKRKIYLHVYCIPVDREHTNMLVCSARTFFGANAITWLFTKFNDILSEDRVIIETSSPAEVPPPGEEPSVATDAPTLYFRKYYFRELRNSSSTLVPAGRLPRKGDDGVERDEVEAPGLSPTKMGTLGAIGIITLGALALGCGSPPRGVDWNGQRLPVVDMHLHPGDWDDIPEDTRIFLASRFPFPLGLDAEETAKGSLLPESIVSEMDAAGVWGGGLFAIYAPRTVGIASNELVAEDLTFAPDRFFGFASLRVDRWNSDRDAELTRLKSVLGRSGFVGIKLAHAHQHFRMDDDAFFPIYEVASSMGKPLYLHTGSSPFPGTAQEAAYTDPTYLEPAIQAFPGARFILGHLGYDFIQKSNAGLAMCIRLAKTYPNVFLEPSALGSASSDPTGENLKEAMRRMREAGVVDRIIYGSDGPQSPGFLTSYLEKTVAAMREAGYSQQEAADVLAGNFARVFGVTIPKDAAQ